MKSALIFAGIILAAAALVAGGGRSSDRRQASADPASPAGTTQAAGYAEPSALVVRRDISGQFHLTAQVNGEDVRFLIDTGADVVALTMEDAQRLGLDADPEHFEAVGHSASGVAYGQTVRLDRIEIDGHELSGVEAVVLGGLRTSLLGQSVLRRLGRIELSGDRMVIRAAS